MQNGTLDRVQENTDKPPGLPSQKYWKYHNAAVGSIHVTLSMEDEKELLSWWYLENQQQQDWQTELAKDEWYPTVYTLQRSCTF